MNLQEIKKMDSQTGNKIILELRTKIFQLNLKLSTKQTVKPHLLKKYKKTIAKILTIQSHKL